MPSNEPSDILHIASEFTNNSVATQATTCQRESCQAAIQIGEPRFYVSEHGHPDRPGRYICGPCMRHYMDKPVTTARIQRRTSSVQVSSSGAAGMHNLASGSQSTSNTSKAVDLSAIRTMINQSQRQGAHTVQGRVTAVSTAPIRPAVSDPRFFQQYFASSEPSSSSLAPSPQPAIGYSNAHRHYDRERENWAGKAYKVPPVPRPISGQLPIHASKRVEVCVVFNATYQDVELAKLAKTAIREGKTVDYGIYPQDLFQLAKTTLLVPLTKWVKGFDWDFSDVILRETLTWQDVLQAEPSVPYFNNRFLKQKPGAKPDKPLVCMPPKTPIEFSLLFDQDQWLRAQQYLTSLVEDSDLVRSERPVTPDMALKRKVPPSPEQLRSPVKPSVPKRQNRLQARSEASTTSELRQDELPIIAPIKSVQASFKRLNVDQVKKGISVGGQEAILDQRKELDSKISETVSCFPVVTIPFAELCEESDSSQKIVDHSKEYIGFLTYEKNNYQLGKGTFKTATLASLTWVSPPPTLGLAAKVSGLTNIALKRPYDDSHGTAKILRYNFSDESRRVLTEATILGWADSLMQFAYEFIDHFMERRPPSKDPFPINIPRLRFVKAAVAYSTTQHAEKVKGQGKSSQASPGRRAYLLEQLLSNDVPFIKYIHNADAVPLQNPEEEGYETAIFLCFIQHVQFYLTHGQAFISDFQGAGDFLTDPQIMTHPILAQIDPNGGVLFGEGNVRDAFENFPTQHICNTYCEWFNLEKPAAATLEEN